MKVPEYLGYWSRDSEFISSDILQVLRRLSLCWRKAPNDRQNDEFLKTCFFVNKSAVGNSVQYFNKNQRKSLIAKDNIWSFPNLYLDMNLCFEYASE